MNDYDDRSDLERYLAGEMSPEEACAFALRVAEDRELRSMVEADRMIGRVVRTDLQSIPPSPIGSRARIREIARSAPRPALPEPEVGEKSYAWIAALIGLGLLVAAAFIIGGNDSDVQRSPVDAIAIARHTDTIRRSDTTSPRKERAPSTPTSPSPRSHAARAAETASPREKTSRLPVSDHRSASHDTVRTALRFIDTSRTVTRSIQADSARVPLTISPAKIHRLSEPEGKP